MGTGHHPCPVPRGELRKQRLRRHTLLCHARRPRHLPPARPRAAPGGFRQNPAHGSPGHARRGGPAHPGGVDVCVSSWKRIAPNTLPSLAKAGANYMNSQLIKMEALTNGHAEGIALDEAGYVSEGSGENIFLVRDGRLHTPPLGASVLPGITRDSVLRLAQDLDIPVVETIVPREMLYIADEVFLTGTAAETTPIRSVDRIPVGKGHRGPITEKLQKEFFALIGGAVPDRYGWLSPVHARQPVGVDK